MVNPITVGNLAFLLFLHAGGSDFRLYDLSDLKTYLLMRWQGPDALAVCRAHRRLPVGFILLWYSVLFTVESLSVSVSVSYWKWTHSLSINYPGWVCADVT